MQINIRGKNIKVSEHFREYIVERVQKLEKFIDNVNDVEVEIAQEKAKNPVERHIVQLTLHVGGSILRAEDHEADAKVALDLVINKMHKQIDRYKARFDRRGKLGQGRNSAAVVNAVNDAETPALVGSVSNGHKDNDQEEGLEVTNRLTNHGIVRSKRFDMKPMYADEAIEQMELLGHNWFVFYDAETEHVNVLYRRTDGTYGMIESTHA